MITKKVLKQLPTAKKRLSQRNFSIYSTTCKAYLLTLRAPSVLEPKEEMVDRMIPLIVFKTC